MSKWKVVKLDDICVNNIQTISSKDDFDIVYVDISSIDNKEKKIVLYQTLNSKEAPSRAKQILNKNDILVSTVRPNLNAVAINQIESEKVVVGSTGYCVLRCSSEVDVDYIFNFCKSKTFINGLVKVAKGASYPAVSNSEVKNSKIPLPPLETQKQIAKTLDTAAELLAMRKQQLAELDNLIKSTFYDMFGDPVTNEKGWEVNTVDKTCSKIMGGGTPSKSHSEYYFGSIPWVTPKDMKTIWINDSIDHISEDAIKNSSAKLIPTNSVLMVIRSGILKKLLPVAINTVDIAINQDMKAFITNEKVVAEYLLYFFKLMQNNILKNVRAVTADNIEFSLIKNMIIPLPPLSFQTQFAEIVIKIEEQKALVKKAIDETQYLYDSLMSEYFE